MGSQVASSAPALPCLWMTAGVLAYRLCDREYDCESCPLDAALRGVGRPTPADLSRPAGLSFPEDRRYHAGHGWVLPEDDRTALVGVDALAARLLAPAGAIVLPGEGAELTAGGAACWVREDGEMIPVKAPLSGIVLSANAAVQLDPGLLLRSPYDRGWLLRVRHGGGTLPGLFDAAQASRRAAEQVRRIRDQAVHGLSARSTTGATLPDGGDLVLELRRVLGIEQYARLIGQLLA